MMTMIPFPLRLEAVKREARLWCERRRLMAHHKDKHLRGGFYLSGGCRCAVGAALPFDLLRQLEFDGMNDAALDDLCDAGYVVISDADRPVIQDIMDRHDAWAVASASGAGLKEVRDLRNEFLAAISAA